jgi:iron complex outermembrane receptor protein
MSWKLGASAQLMSITGYVEQHNLFNYDNDGTALSLIVHNDVANRAEQISQELTYTGNLADRLDLIAGALYLHAKQDSLADVLVPPAKVHIATSGDQFLTSWAGYGQLRYHLTDDIRLTAGARYTHDKKESIGHGNIFVGDPVIITVPQENQGFGSWNAVTPKFSIDYEPSTNLTVYASASRDTRDDGPVILSA